MCEYWIQIDKVSKTDSDSGSYHNATHSENNQHDLPKNSFSRLGPNWGKKSFALLLRESFSVYTILTSPLQMNALYH